MADWSKPSLTDTYANFLALLGARDTDLAAGLDPARVSVTNPPANAIRWNSANGYWEYWNGTAWGVLAVTYNIVAAQAAKLKTPATISLTGDISGSAGFDGSAGIAIAATLPNVNANAGTAGSATTVPVVTTNAKGLVTAVGQAPISFPAAPVTSVFGRTGAVTLASSDVTGALGFTPQAALGFTPVQQGGGTGQGTNKVYLGWSGSQLSLQVDSTNFGATWPIGISGNAATATSATSAASATAVPWTGVSGKPTVVSAVTWPGYPGSLFSPPASYQISSVTISGSTLVFTTNCNCNCGC